MKLLKMAFLLPAVAVLLVSCAPNMDSFTGGAVLAVDADNHLTEDVVYTYDSSTYTFKQSGEYEFVSKLYETDWDYNGNGITNEGWVTNGGITGTYSWDAKSYLLTLNYSQFFNSSTNLWLPATTNNTVKQVGHALFTARNFASTSLFSPLQMIKKSSRRLLPSGSGSSIYVKDGTNESDFYTETINTDFEGINQKIKVRYSFTDSKIDYNVFMSTTSNTTILEQGESKTSYKIISLYPADSTFKLGSTSTFTVESFEMLDRDYDTTNSTWLDWVLNTNISRSTLAFAHIGEYIIANPTLTFARETE